MNSPFHRDSPDEVVLDVLRSLDRDPTDSGGWAKTALIVSDDGYDTVPVALLLGRLAHLLSGALDVAALGEDGWASPNAPAVVRMLLDNQSTLPARPW